MYDTCLTGCCSTNVPVRDSSHAKCHCGDTHWCESPVLKKRVSSCDDGCNSTKVTSLQNCDEVYQYIDGLRDEHLGNSEHNMNRTLHDISKPDKNCCTPRTQCGPVKTSCSTTTVRTRDQACGIGYRCETDPFCNDCNSNSCGCDDTCGCGVPDMHYEDLNCSTANNGSCCTSGNRGHILGLANRVRGRLNHRCHTYGNIREFVKEIPAANVFLVNHEFIDLLIDEIKGCLPSYNMSREVVSRVKHYVQLYYVYYNDLELVGSLIVNDLIPIGENLITTDEEANRTKAILYALSDRLEGRVYEYEQ